MMCDEVREALKKLNYSRYRFVVSGKLLLLKKPWDSPS